jgi:polar amino acid transport system substrate-binding protein
VGVTAVIPAAGAVIDYSTPVMLLPHTLVVPAGSSIATVAEADRAGVRIASERGSPHTAQLQAMLPHATVVLVDDFDAGLAMVRSGRVDAFAAGRFALDQVLKRATGMRIVDGDFFVLRVALAVHKGWSADVVAMLSRFVDEAKGSGLIGQAIAATGFQDVDVAPASGS